MNENWNQELEVAYSTEDLFFEMWIYFAIADSIDWHAPPHSSKFQSSGIWNCQCALIFVHLNALVPNNS